MRLRTQWYRKYVLGRFLRVGVRVSDAVLAALTACRWSARSNGSEPEPFNGIHTEEAFRCLLESESKRSERSGQFCLILLISRTNAQGTVVPIGADIAKTVIAALSRSLRDTDYIGWYREKHIVGALLTVLGRNAMADGRTRFQARLEQNIRSHLPLVEPSLVQIQVLRHDEVARVESIQPA